jgi:putative tryptophan/tyrosine transport system substrate-binding protein
MIQRRRVFECAAACVGTLTLWPAARAQRVYRIAFLFTSGHIADWPLRGAFLDGMRELGWVQGQHYQIESEQVNGRSENLQAAAAELVRREPDLLIGAGSPPTAALMAATRRIPIVFFYVGDPERSGFVSSLARPGGNLTGFGGLGAGLHARQLALLSQTVPSARKLAVLINPDFSFHQAVWPELQETASRLGLSIRRVELRSPRDLDAALGTIAPRPAERGERGERADMVHIVGQPFLIAEARRLTDWAVEHRMPVMTPFTQLARAGLLLAYTGSLEDDVRQMPGYIVRILRDGARPADLPVRQPTRFDFVVNLKAARQIGFSVPQSVLLQATELIE